MSAAVPFDALPAVQRRYKLRRAALYFVPGLVVGVLWLMPVFTRPGGVSLAGSGSSIARYLRVLSVAVLLPFVWTRLRPSLGRERVLRAALVVFVVLPFLGVVNFPQPAFIVGTVGPFVVGGVSLLCLAGLRDDEFRYWLSGVGLAAAGFVGGGLLAYGLETTGFYGRPRVHLGFDHPTQSASALCAAALYVALVVANAASVPRVLRRAALVVLTCAVAYLLVLVSSRNTLLLVLVTLALAGWGRVARGALPRFVALTSILALFPGIMLFAARGNQLSPVWQIANTVSSFRLTIYHDMLERLAREDGYSLLFGPTYVVREVKAGTMGFAAIDSTYLTILLNYGVLTALAFYAFWLALGLRVCRRGRPLDFGVFCAISTYLLLDAQGVTPSNMLVFGLLAHSLRVALRHRAAARGTARGMEPAGDTP